MIAMMVPSATPAILLFARVQRQAQARGPLAGGATSVSVFVLGYLLVWGVFSLVATVLQFALEQAALIAMMGMGSRMRWLSGGLLIVAGLYQFSPLKHACLNLCRSPASFLSRYHRPGASGALGLGIRHGAYCLGCCWLLMLLLFVGGVMNLVWILALTLLVLAEKLLPGGAWVGRITGALLLLWGAAIGLGGGVLAT
jgi:predicted metal-binding membrane protein